MATADFSIDFPARDVQALLRQMQRATREVGISVGQSVRWGISAVARSVAASTKVSGKYRDLRITGKGRGNNKRIEVTSYVGGRKKTFDVFAPGLRAARQMRQVQIARRGLAKMTWGAALRHAKAGSIPGASPKGLTGRKAEQASSGAGRYRGDDPFGRITNELPYAESALQGGKRDVSTAMERASRAVAQRIDREIMKKYKAK